jgi:hypothetical protein
MSLLSCDWGLIAEGIYLEYDVMAIGLCNSTTNEIVLNPSRLELHGHKFRSRFFKDFDMVIVLSDSEVTAQLLSRGLEDDDVVNNILDRLAIGEERTTWYFFELLENVAYQSDELQVFHCAMIRFMSPNPTEFPFPSKSFLT